MLAGADGDDIGVLFAKYDVNKDGVIDQFELAAMFTDLGYDGVDDDYVAGMMTTFGRFDIDHDGMINENEFAPLWRYLQDSSHHDHDDGEGPIVSLSSEEYDESTSSRLVSPARQKTVSATFQQYDTNNDGVLDEMEVSAMMNAVGFEVDGDYVKGVMNIFGKFDADIDGGIDVTEFGKLWAYLGGGAFGQ
eukprot:COSAG05_NODE_1725_length_4206_cov_2.026784_4_plen_191_part_00